MQWVLSSKEINFPYPLGLTLLHMVFSSVLCFILTRAFKVFGLLNSMLGFVMKQFRFIYAILILISDSSQVLKVEEGMTLEL